MKDILTWIGFCGDGEREREMGEESLTLEASCSPVVFSRHTLDSCSA